MRFWFATILCLCCSFLISMVQGQEDSFLDLTKVKPPMRKELVLKDGGGVSGSHDTPFPKLPLEITLLSLDKSSYQS